MKYLIAALLSFSASHALMAAPAPLATLVEQVQIPYESFVLNNGLRVVVHTDRKAPIVSVGVWYHVGSRDEPLGKSGFAHLFEHLMFYGSEHNPEGHFKPLEALGASDFNGTTSFDRTNYFQTVPTPALELALFLESDRMGWLLPALTQEKLDAQRGVVLNEKRQGDNQPYGLVRYEMLKSLFPLRHPMRISPIGREEDLKQASLDDARGWFRSHYGPNNAVLVLAGDIDASTARPLVEKMFGNIPPGPGAERLKSWVPARSAVTSNSMTDAIAAPRLSRYWVAPPQSATDSADLQIALAILASGPTSRLYQTLVRDEKLAVSVYGGTQFMETAGISSISADAAPGVDPEKLQDRIGEVLADFLKHGPTQDEVERVAMRAVSGTIRGLEKIGGFGGKGTALAEGMLYENDPGNYKTELKRFADATPETVVAAARRWLAQNDHRLSILPGKREPTHVSVAQEAPDVDRPESPAPAARLLPGYDRSQGMPSAGDLTEVRTPAIERARLDNGMQLVFVRSAAVPVVRIALDVPLGISRDSREMPGLQAMTLALLDEGTNGKLGKLDGPEIARRMERLGAAFSTSTTLDRTRISLNSLTPNLHDSLALFADMVRAPVFPEAEIERIRTQAQTGLKAELTSPSGLAFRVLPSLLYGEAHPYGQSFSGSGTEEGLKSISRADIKQFHQLLAHPDATFFVVGDTSLEEVRTALNGVFGDWAAKPEAVKTQDLQTVSTLPPRITLIDRPDSPQSLIVAGQLLPATGPELSFAMDLANDVFGGLASSRLFQELREKRNWSYGASSRISAPVGPMPFILSAPVESGRTADAVVTIQKMLTAYESSAPATDEEIAQAKAAAIRSLAGYMETGGALLSTLMRNQLLARPDDYLETYGRNMAAVTKDEVRAAPLPKAENLQWIIVGDKEVIEPQLKAAGLSWSETEVR